MFSITKWIRGIINSSEQYTRSGSISTNSGTAFLDSLSGDMTMTLSSSPVGTKINIVCVDRANECSVTVNGVVFDGDEDGSRFSRISFLRNYGSIELVSIGEIGYVALGTKGVILDPE